MPITTNLDKSTPSNFQLVFPEIPTGADSEAIEEILTTTGNPLDYETAHIYLTEDNVFYSSSSSGGQFILIPREGVNEWGEVHKYISGDTSN